MLHNDSNNDLVKFVIILVLILGVIVVKCSISTGSAPGLVERATMDK